MQTALLHKAQLVLREVWGYDRFRPLQEQSIACVLEQRDSLTVLPTGGGKSICFQAPALCLDGLAVVVSPLISLMKDQVDALQTCGVSAAFVNSTQSDNEKRQVADLIRQGKLKLLYVAPERLLTPRMLDFLRQIKVSLFAIDEAHCISNWGHDFRPEYRGLRVLKEQFPKVAVHAFTATASAPVRHDIALQLGLRDAEILVGDFDRPNLVYRMLRANNRMQQVLEVIERHRGESGIVYCISRRDVDRTASVLLQMGCRALPYHAGMDDHQRKANQEAFIKEQCDVIVATVAFGMGIDKSNVRYVVHSGMPKSIEHYQQESGRAGRDGLPSDCVLIYSGGDVVTWKKIMEGERTDGSDGALKALDAMSLLCSGSVCRHKAIVEYFGQPYLNDHCGGCDVCLNEVELVDDPITLSQKILSCVVRVGERFGAAHTTKVLVGANESRIRELGHDKLSTFGLLKSEGPQATRMWIDQLLAQDFLQRTGEYQVLSLTESGRRLLRREGNPRLTAAAAATKATRQPVGEDTWEGVDRKLFEQLRELRGNLATSRNVPAYIVLADSVLRDLARYRPDSSESFGQIRGVGEKKQHDFGPIFIEMINQYCQQHSVATNVAVPIEPLDGSRPIITNNSAFAAYDYFRNGETVEAVAAKMGRATSTVYGYLNEYLKHDQITDSSRWVDEPIRTRILSQIHLIQGNRLKPLFEHFGGDVSYDLLRIVATCHSNQVSSPVTELAPSE